MKKNWTALDHAAKLFTAGTGKRETQVFRFACELHNYIDPSILQAALDATIEFFPSYRVVLRKGFFWYYLEESTLQPLALPETKTVCQDMKCTSSKKLLFEVTYFNRRINLEVYHALSDGSSAMNFFKTLIRTYLSMITGKSVPSPEIDSSYAQSKLDSYDHYYTGDYCQREKTVQACKIQGFKYNGGFLRNITGQLSASKISAMAGEYNASVTVFLSACIISAIGQNVKSREKKKPIVLSVPVDLRSYFPSASARNFFGSIRVSYYWKNDKNKSGNVKDNNTADSNSIENIITEIKPQFRRMLNREYLSMQIDGQSHAEHNIFAKIAPLMLKNLVLKLIYKHSLKGITATISNMGKISLEPEFAAKIRSFDICMYTNRLEFAICSFEDILSIGCTTTHISSDIEKTFFRMFTDKNIDVEINSNITEDTYL